MAGHTVGQKKNFFPVVHWTSNVQILVVLKLNSLVQKRKIIQVNDKISKKVEIL